MWIFTLFTLSLVVGCAKGSGDPPAAPAGPELAFSVSGVASAPPSFGPALSEMDARWVFDPQTERTTIHVSGRDAEWHTTLNVILPLQQAGRYEADPSHRGIDRAFQVTLYNDLNGALTALIAVDAHVELSMDPHEPDALVGQFAGRFAVGKRSTGRDILRTPPEERVLAEIKNGSFRALYRDTLHDRGQRWPAKTVGLSTAPEPR